MAKKDDEVVDDKTVRGTPLIPDDDPEWGNPVQLTEPELFNEMGKSVRKEEVVEKKVEEPEGEEEEIEEENDGLEYEPTINVEDPGEFTPVDYSFDVTVYDKEGNSPRTLKINSINEWDKLLADDTNFGSAQALMVAERKATKMESNSERDKADFDKQKAEYDKAVEDVQGREQSLDTLVSEMEYLESRGDVTKIPVKFRNDWTSAEAKKDPAVKEQQALIAYMDKENRARQKANLPIETSLISAFKSFRLDQMEKEEADEQKIAGQARREAGARIAGTTPGATVTAPKGIAVGRAGSLNDLSANSW